jgi:2-iminobutanoate/2-iminopropanoate deaminase
MSEHPDAPRPDDDEAARRQWRPVTLGPDVPPPAGAYSPGVRAGNLLFVSGQVPRDLRTGAVVGDNVAAQTRQVLGNLEAVLRAGGATLADVVAVTVYLADEGDWGTFNDVYRSTFHAPYPTRTVVGARLRGILVELSAVAVVAE